MKRFLILPLLLGVSLPLQAGVDPEVHKLCKDVKDYLGCVKAQGSKSTDIPSLRVIQGKRELTGNSCPSGWAYLGGGYCQEVKCLMDSFGSNHPTVAGKGWVCPKKPLFGKGFLVLGNSAIPAITDQRCPDEEPEIGKNNSCLNELSEGQVFAHRLANTQRPNKIPVDWSKHLNNMNNNLNNMNQ